MITSFYRSWLYKLESGKYPDSPQQLLNKNDFVLIYDPTQTAQVRKDTSIIKAWGSIICSFRLARTGNLILKMIYIHRFKPIRILAGSGGNNHNRLGACELVAFTKEPLNENDDVPTAFNTIERCICGTFTTIASYSFDAVLDPYETCEVPAGENEYSCVVFDNYQPDGKEFHVGVRKHHLLLCLEVFRTEMEYARNHGSRELIKLLKEKGCYPYSDLVREPVA